MIRLLGVPYDSNSSFLQGPSKAPIKMREMDTNGSANRYSESGIEINTGINYQDIGDLTLADLDAEKAFQNILSSVRSEISNGDKLICIGGDHSISYPIIKAHSEVYPQLNVLHFDAHSDVYADFEGNPYSHASPFARIMEEGKVNSLTQVGIRTLNDHQRDQANKYQVKIIEMQQLTLDFVEELEGPLYISLDIDVLDPAFAPGISHHEPGGMSTRKLIEMIQKIEAPIVGADIVEYNPTRDINDMTAMVVYKLFKEIAAKMI